MSATSASAPKTSHLQATRAEQVDSYRGALRRLLDTKKSTASRLCGVRRTVG